MMFSRKKPRDKKSGVAEGFAWVFLERISAQLVSTVVSIILARILLPSDYGLIAIVNIFIVFADVFLSYGFNNALIQKKDADELDYSSVLYFNIFLTVILYLILFFCAPWLSEFYGDGYELLTPVLRVLGLRLIINGINSVQQAYVSKKMIFRLFFFSTMGGTVISAIIGIAMALGGFGVWALVAQTLSSIFVNTIILTILLQWKPLLKFSYSRLKSLWRYGSFMLVSGILMRAFEEIRALIIGKKYSLDEFAFYEKGKQFPALIVNNINTAIGTVLFPKLSNEQDSIVKLKQTTRSSIKFSSFVMCPLLLGFLVIAENFVIVVLTAKWLPAAKLLQCFCLFYLFQPMHTANIQAIKALGRSDIFLKLEIFKKSIEIITLIITISISVNAVVYGMAILSFLFVFVNAYPNIKLLNYNIKEQCEDMFIPLINAAIMAAAIWIIDFLPMPDLWQMIIQIIAGAVIYILLNIIEKNEQFEYLWSLAKSKFIIIRR